VFAYLQSAAMGGYRVALVNGIIQALGMISGAAVKLRRTTGLGGRTPGQRHRHAALPNTHF
jgi:hypothetical protein